MSGPETLHPSQNEEIEVGVAFALSEEQTAFSNGLTEQLKTSFQSHGLAVSEIKNKPHITLFQLRIPTSSRETLENEIATIYKSVDFDYPIQVKMKTTLTDTGRYIFWEVENFSKNQEIIYSFHKNLVDRIKNYRSTNLMQQLDLESLGETELKIIQSYGIHWSIPGPSYNPHITIIYPSGKGCLNPKDDLIKIQTLLPQNFAEKTVYSLSEIILGKLGPEGQVVQVLKSFPILKSENC